MKRIVRSNWSTTVLVCAKCTKKVGGGFGEKGKTPLVKALKQFGGGKKRKAPFGVIETKCLGICPKGAVVAVDAAHPGLWQIIDEGTAMDEVVERLGLANNA